MKSRPRRAVGVIWVQLWFIAIAQLWTAAPVLGQSQSLVTVTVPLDIEQVHSSNIYEVDVPLPESVSLVGLNYVTIEGWGIHSTRTLPGSSTWGAVVSANLLNSSGQEILFVPGLQLGGKVGPNFDLVARCKNDVINSSSISGTATAVRLHIGFNASAGAPYTTRFEGIHAGQTMRVHFAYGGLGFNGPHAQQTFSPEYPLFGGNVIPWQYVGLTHPVSAAGLRLVTTEIFEFNATPGIQFATHVQVVFDDDSVLTLDDFNAPSTLGVSTTTSFTNSLLLDDPTLESLLDRTIVGFRWRFQIGPPGSFVAEIPLHINQVRFLFDAELPIVDCNDNDIPDQYDPDTDGDGYPDGCSPFVRGLCNADPVFDLGDAIFLLSAVFGQGPQPSCRDACDMNDDGLLNIADPIEALSVLFGGALLPEPLGGCGDDPTSDSLTCGEFSCP